MSMPKIIEKLFFSWNWLCAYRVIKDEEMGSPAVFKEDEIRDYKLIDVKKNFWLADPFVYTKDGVTVAFFELMSQQKHKAMLAAKQILPTEGELKVIYEFPGHTSYPCVFEHNDALYMIPETGVNRTVELFQCTQWPYKWEKKCNLIENLFTADCTPFKIEDQWYLFVYVLDKSVKPRDLMIGKFNPENGTVTDLKLAKHYEDLLGRPGGHCFEENGKKIRVVQPSNVYYSEKIEFFEFDYKNEEFSETKIGEMVPKNIRLDNPKVKIVGTHTFNRYGNIEIIDVLTKKKFLPLRPLKYLFKKFELFGYGFYDRDRKYMNNEKPLHLDN